MLFFPKDIFNKFLLKSSSFISLFTSVTIKLLIFIPLFIIDLRASLFEEVIPFPESKSSNFNPFCIFFIYINFW